ncbi:AfsR/SARP family transcriptional regulator [Virgisporangium aurantiacum]|uniref:XRE family transcriptional regulator n=1 Tax=Virgisporangium aurantiacum TaxID=175570 RepID=A0A8J3ZDL1_9ACTN|nr:tetratricopeptide repeat protein [Virgisporangium aurantiacum]GIJ62239.1 XRE family transcriptional regulator [Virgisporangium aurantiacum]
MEFRLLGPIEAWHLGHRVPLGRRRERCLLGLLLLDAGRLVLVDRLVDQLWVADPPSNARAQLRVNVSRLRRRLDPDGTAQTRARLITRGPGYVIETDPDTVDVHRFRTAVRQACLIAEPAARSARLADALALWRGPLMADSMPAELRARVGLELDELRLQAVELRAEADLAVGDAGRVLAALAPLVEQDPLQERLVGLFMRALDAAGRRSEALTVYQATRTRLAEDLGVDPGAELIEAYTAILRTEAPEAPEAPEALAVNPGVGPAARPAQLPAGTWAFVGRAAEARQLIDALARPAGSDLAPPVVVVSGTAGVGKTALAVHCAHQVRTDFPDGQLYVDLRGYDTDRPVTATEALAGFLRALGVDGAQIPVDPAERSAMFRSTLGDRRMLLMLDNAASVEQVRPLLPGRPSAAVMVTSRDDLSGLVARDGARRITLGVLAPAEAVDLLRSLIGARVDLAPEAASRLAERAVRLPLALRVAAELAASRPTVPLRVLDAELADERRRLDLLDVHGDERTAVRSVLSWSYRRLPADARQGFRRLGVHPGRTVDHAAAAALFDASPDGAGRILDRLTRSHLIAAVAPGRVGMHDLLRVYAAECADEDDEPARRAAVRRLLEHYVAAGRAAVAAVFPDGSGTAEGSAPFTDADAARRWLETELENLVAVVARAADDGWERYAVELIAVLWPWLDTASYHLQAAAMLAPAVAAASATGDVAGEAMCRRQLGTVEWRWGRHDRALEQFVRALALVRRAGDRSGEAGCLNNIGTVHARWSRHDEAIEHLRQAIAIYQELGDHRTQGRVASNLGVVYWQTGRYRQARDQYLDALAIARESGDAVALGGMLDNLGNACDRLGDYAAAERHHRAAYAAHHAAGSRLGEAEALDNLAGTLVRQGRPDEALDLLARALPIYEEVGDRAGTASALDHAGGAYARLGRYREALDQHRRALAVATEIGVPGHEASALNGVAEVRAAMGDHAASREHHQRAAAVAARVGDRYEQARATAGIARVEAAVGNAAAADRLRSEAASRFAEMGVPTGIG